jgi:protein SMG7
VFSDHPVTHVQLPEQPHGQDSAAEIRQQKVLAAVRDLRVDSPVEMELEDDNMTEITSRTDEDVLRDAFRFLDTSAEEDDEIVWDPRYTSLCYIFLSNKLTRKQGSRLSCCT